MSTSPSPPRVPRPGVGSVALSTHSHSPLEGKYGNVIVGGGVGGNNGVGGGGGGGGPW